MSLGSGDMNLPYEPTPPGTEVPLDDAQLAGGMVVMAACVPVDGMGPQPALVYRFANPDGSGFYPPVVLVVSDEEMRAAARLTEAAVNGAIRETRKRRRL